MKTLYGTLYNSNILYNVGSICTNAPSLLEFEFITTEIQFNIKLFGNKHCLCKEQGLFQLFWEKAPVLNWEKISGILVYLGNFLEV